MSAVSGAPSSVTTPSFTMTEYQLGSVRPRITWLIISSRISASGRSKTPSTSLRLTMPTSRPPTSTTGRRLTRCVNISRAACSTVSSGPTVTAGLVISSAALTPSALARPPRSKRRASAPLMPPGSLSAASLTSRSASETTPVTRPSASRTGNALTRSSRSLAAISLNDVLSLTHTGRADMTSLTTAFIGITLPIALPML
jgi:hypothetical protein